MINIKKSHLCILGSLIFVMIFYGKVLLDPNGYFFSIAEDGVSNYYSYAYHVKHDASYTEFSGMKYPFGEYLPFVDANPSLSNFLKLVSDGLIDLSDYSVGILNLSMLLSIVLTAFFLFLILAHYGIDSYGGVLGALGITILSSQSILWEFGHYALSYSCFIPISWYLSIRFFNTSAKTKWSWWIAANSIIWIYTHNYLGFMVLYMNFCAMLLGLFIFKNKPWTEMQNYVHLGIQIAVPLLIVYLSLGLLDNHEGRFEWPFVSAFRGSTWSVFYPIHSFTRPIYDLILSIPGWQVPDSSEQSWLQVGTFIGTSSIVITLVAFIKYTIEVIRKKISVGKVPITKELTLYLLPAVIFLFYSMGYPFRIFPSLADLMPVLKQFISLGRFGWLFYFTFTVYSLWLIPKIFNTKYSELVLIIASVLMIGEGISTHNRLSDSITRFSNFFEDDRSGDGLFRRAFRSEIKEKYQAILPLPFYYKWNTPFDYGGTARSEQVSMRLSYFTGLPLMSSFLARPSISEGEEIVSVFRPNNRGDELKTYFKDKKPILVVWPKDKLNNLENIILSKCKLVEGNTKYNIYSLSPDDIFQSDEHTQMEAFMDDIKGMTYDTLSGFYHPNEPIFAFYNGFDSDTSRIKFRGNGAYTGKKKEENLIYTSRPNDFISNQRYILSFWYYNKLNRYSYNEMWLDEIDTLGRKISSRQFLPFSSILFDRHWALNEFFFQVSNPKNIIVLRSKGEDILENEFYIDELLIRPPDVNLYKVQYDQDAGKRVYIKNNLDLFSR